MRIPLHLGAMEVAGYRVIRSGLRWLRRDGALCRAGEPIAYCNVGLVPDGAASPPTRLVEEKRDLQAVFATPVGGVLRQAAALSRGGFLDQHPDLFWHADTEIGAVEPLPDPAAPSEAPAQLRLMMLAGRRMSELAEGRSGLLTSWHDRSRAWWGDDTGPHETLLSIGTCELAGVMRGEAGGFLELFRDVGGPIQAVMIEDEPLVPCVRVLFEQMIRSPAEREAIAEDAARTFVAGGLTPAPADWLFMGALLSALLRSPLTDTTDLLTRQGIVAAPAANAVVLSLAAEGRDVLRHRRLGYTLSLYDFRLAQSGPAVRAWLRANFVVVQRGPDEIRHGYLRFLDALRERTGARVLVLNRIATDAQENIHLYAGLEAPMSGALQSVRTRELNLMLHDLSRDHALDIVDLESIAAGLGVARHIPDYLHPSGRLQAELRAALLGLLRARGFIGVTPQNSFS